MESSKNLIIIEDTIIYQNIKYENIKPKGTIFSDNEYKIMKAEDQNTFKQYCIRIIPINNEDKEENIKAEILFLEKVCKYYYKPKLFPTYFGYIKLISSGEPQYLFFFNYMKTTLLDYLQTKEKQKNRLPLETIMKLFDVFLNGLAFCQAMGIVLKDFSFQKILCSIDSENCLLNFTNFISIGLYKPPIFQINSQINDILFPPELFNNESKNSKLIDPYKSGVFCLGLIILRMCAGRPIFDDNSINYVTIIRNESEFDKFTNILFNTIEKRYISENNSLESFLSQKLLNELRLMLKFKQEDRPDFVELYRRNIDLEDLEKVKAHILVSEGFMLPLLEKYDHLEVSSPETKKKDFQEKVFELNSIDKMVKISGIGKIQIKQNFNDPTYI